MRLKMRINLYELHVGLQKGNQTLRVTSLGRQQSIPVHYNIMCVSGINNSLYGLFYRRLSKAYSFHTAYAGEATYIMSVSNKNKITLRTDTLFTYD